MNGDGADNNHNQESTLHDKKELNQSLDQIQNLIQPGVTLCNERNDLLQVPSSQVLSSVGDGSLVRYMIYGQPQETLMDMPDNGNKLDFQYQNMEIFDDYFIQYLNPNIHITTTILPTFEENVREYLSASQNFSITRSEQRTQNVRKDLILCQPYEPPTIMQYGSCKSSEAVCNQNASLFLFQTGERTQGSIELNRETIFPNAMPDYDSNSLDASISESTGHQISSENLLICQSFKPHEIESQTNHESINNDQNVDSLPIIIASQERDPINILFQAFEPPNNNNANTENGSHSWCQDNNFQYLIAPPSPSASNTSNTVVFQHEISQQMARETIDLNITKSTFSQYMRDASQQRELHKEINEFETQ